MTFIDRLEKEITAYFQMSPDKEVTHCDMTDVGCTSLKFFDYHNDICQGIGVIIYNTPTVSNYEIQVYTLECGSFTFYPIKCLEDKGEDITIKMILRLMRDDQFFNSSGK